MRRVAIGLAAILLGAVAIALYAQEKPKDSPAPAAKPEVITVKGEVVDLWCFLDHGGRGDAHKECAVTCAKGGNPIGLVDEKGQAYLLIGAEMHKSMHDDFIKQMALTVTAKGKLVKSGGLQALYVESMEAAK
jgi:hypothetical protein